MYRISYYDGNIKGHAEWYGFLELFTPPNILFTPALSVIKTRLRVSIVRPYFYVLCLSRVTILAIAPFKPNSQAQSNYPRCKFSSVKLTKCSFGIRAQNSHVYRILWSFWFGEDVRSVRESHRNYTIKNVPI